jgi:WD40 repeat protein
MGIEEISVTLLALALLQDLPEGAVRRFGSVHLTHQGMVLCVAYSPDGRSIASGAADGTARVWDSDTGRQIHRFSADRREVRSVAFSPDGKRLATAGYDHRVLLWDLSTGKEARRFSGHENCVNSVCFSGDGKLLASGSNDNTVRIWNVETGEAAGDFLRHEDDVRSIAFLPDGERILAASGAKVHVWKLKSRKETAALSVGRGEIRCLAVSPDGKLIGTGDEEGLFQVTDISDSSIHLARFFEKSPVSAVAATGAQWIHAADDTVRGGEERLKYGSRPTSLAVAPDGKRMAIGFSDKRIRILDLETWIERTPVEGHSARVTSVLFAADGKRVLSASWDRTVRQWDLASAKSKILHDATQPVLEIAQSPDGLSLAVGTESSLVVFDSTEKERGRFDEGSCGRITYSADGKKLGYATEAGFAILDVEAWVSSRPDAFVGFGAGGNAALSPDGKSVALAQDRILLLSDETGENSRELGQHEAAIAAIEFSSDGTMLATGGREGAVKLWDLALAKEAACLRGHDGRVNAVALSPDGSLAVSGGADGRVVLWDLWTGKAAARFEGHSGEIVSVDISRDGRFVASGSEDGTVLLWQAGRAAAVDGPFDEARAWKDLGSDDPGVALPAMAQLAGRPDLARVVQARLDLRPEIPARLSRWIEMLDDDDPAVRDEASRELAKLGSQAEPALNRAMASSPSDEIKARLTPLLEGLAKPPYRGSEVLTGLRAVTLLERARAVDLLTKVKDEAPWTAVRRRAEAALNRLSKR